MSAADELTRLPLRGSTVSLPETPRGFVMAWLMEGGRSNISRPQETCSFFRHLEYSFLEPCCHVVRKTKQPHIQTYVEGTQSPWSYSRTCCPQAAPPRQPCECPVLEAGPSAPVSCPS